MAPTTQKKLGANRHSAAASLFLVACLAAFAPAWAQDDESPDDAGKSGGYESDRPGRLFAQIDAWVAQPVGLQYGPATRSNPGDPFDTVLLRPSHGTDRRLRYRTGFRIGPKVGEFILTWYAHEDDVMLQERAPGEFVFGETLPHPFHAGIFDDGRADAFDALAATKLRDFRLDLYRPVFETPHMQVRWFVGVRRVFHRREQRATYYSLVPNLPPVLPTRPDLLPQPDIATLESKFNGRGAEAGLEIRFPTLLRRLAVEAGLNVGVLRGTVDTSYRSVTAFYFDTRGGGSVIGPPYAEFTDPDLQGTIVQRSIPLGLDALRLPVDSIVIETFLGLRLRAWRTLEVVAGFRNMRMDNAAIDLRPSRVGVSLNGVVNLEDVEQTSRSVGYEGFYLGVAYRH